MKKHLQNIQDHIIKNPELWEYRIDFPEYYSWFTKKSKYKFMPIPVFNIFSGDIVESLKKQFVSATVSQKPDLFGHFNHYFKLNDKQIVMLALRSDDNHVWYDVFMWGTNMAQGAYFCKDYEKYNITDIISPEKKFGFGVQPA